MNCFFVRQALSRTWLVAHRSKPQATNIPTSGRIIKSDKLVCINLNPTTLLSINCLATLGTRDQTNIVSSQQRKEESLYPQSLTSIDSRHSLPFIRGRANFVTHEFVNLDLDTFVDINHFTRKVRKSRLLSLFFEHLERESEGKKKRNDWFVHCSLFNVNWNSSSRNRFLGSSGSSASLQPCDRILFNFESKKKKLVTYPGSLSRSVKINAFQDIHWSTKHTELTNSWNIRIKLSPFCKFIMHLSLRNFLSSCFLMSLSLFSVKMMWCCSRPPLNELFKNRLKERGMKEKRRRKEGSEGTRRIEKLWEKEGRH